MSRRKTTHIRVWKDDVIMAKKVAVLQGMSLQEYFKKKVELDSVTFPEEVMRCGTFDDLTSTRYHRRRP
jgi:hypothetical protein